METACSVWQIWEKSSWHTISGETWPNFLNVFSPENRPEVGDGSFPGGWLLEMMIQLEEQILFKQVGGKTHHLILPHNFAGLEFSYGKPTLQAVIVYVWVNGKNQESNKTLFDNQH